MGVPVYWPLRVLCVYMCVMSNQSTSKKPHVSGLSKLDALLHKTHSKVLLVLRYQDLRSIISIKSQSGASNVARSPIQPKKQDHRKSSEGGG